jgi:hypothetical protein
MGEALGADLPPQAHGIVTALGPTREEIGLPGIEDLAAALRLAPFGRRAEGEIAVDRPATDADHPGDVRFIGGDGGEDLDALGSE